MVDHNQYKLFLADKGGFFTSVPTSTAEAKIRAEGQTYAFLARNRLLIEQEFNQLFTSLEKQGDDRREFWLYCYYCCVMLQTYYTSYNKKKEAKKYEDKAKELLYRATHGRFADPHIQQQGFLRSLSTKIAADLADLATIPKHTSEIEKWLAFVNIYRIHFTFCRIFIKQSILFARELEWLKQLQELAGSNVDDMIKAINGPSQIFYCLSVGLMVARFMINAGSLLKHTLCATQKERGEYWDKRFTQELYKRHPVMLNDMVWGTVNLITNYPTLLNISAPLAGWLTAGFMAFDVSLLVYRRYLNDQEHSLKEAQYIAERDNYIALLSALSLSDADRKKYVAHIKMLDDQLKELNISWKASNATFLFNIVAAALLMGGFTASMLAVTPAAITVFYLVCTIGVAMYLSDNAYKEFKEKSLILEQLNKDGVADISEALDKMQKARRDFMLIMAKNIIIPLLIVSLFAVSWQAAFLFVGVYVGYECLHGYFKGSKNDPSAPASPTSSDGSSPGGASDDTSPGSSDEGSDNGAGTGFHPSYRPGGGATGAPPAIAVASNDGGAGFEGGGYMRLG